MGDGVWTRFGRGSCEGYGLELGSLMRFTALHTPQTASNPNPWTASLNEYDLGKFETFDAAVAKVDHEARIAMGVALEHWVAKRFIAPVSAKR